MFFERFAVTLSAVQKNLATANDASPEGLLLDELDAVSLDIIRDPELLPMLATNEPPATRFVCQRVRPLVRLATRLGRDESAELCRSALAALCSGSPQVARATLCDDISVTLLSTCLELGASRLAEGGNAGCIVSAAVDDSAFEATLLEQWSASQGGKAIVAESPGGEVLPMHAANVLSSAFRATTSAPPSFSISETFTLSQTAPGNSRSTTLETALQEHGRRIGVAIAASIGLVKETRTMLLEVFAISSVAVSFAQAFIDRLAAVVGTGVREAQRSFVPRAQLGLQCAAVLSVCDAVAGRASPRSNEGMSFATIVESLLATPAFLSFVVTTFFSDFGPNAASTTAMRRASLQCLTNVLLRGRWKGVFATAMHAEVARQIRKLSSCPSFLAALRNEYRRNDQLDCMCLLRLGIDLVRKVVLRPPGAAASRATPEHLSAAPQPRTAEAIRALLPAREALSLILRLSLADPNCDVLHSTVNSLADSIGNFSGRGGLSKSSSLNAGSTDGSAAAATASLLDEECAAVAASVAFDDLQLAEVLPVMWERGGLEGHAVLLAGALASISPTFAAPQEVTPERARLRETLRAMDKYAAEGLERDRGSLEDDDPLERLRRYCNMAVRPIGDFESSQTSLFSSREGSRVVVDEVDDIDAPPAGGNSAGDQPVVPGSTQPPFSSASPHTPIDDVAPTVQMLPDPSSDGFASSGHGRASEAIPEPLGALSTSDHIRETTFLEGGGTAQGTLSVSQSSQSTPSTASPSTAGTGDGCLSSDFSAPTSTTHVASGGSTSGKFRIKRRADTSTSASANATPSPRLDARGSGGSSGGPTPQASGSSVLPETTTSALAQQQLSLTNSLNESVHSSFERRSMDVADDRASHTLQPVLSREDPSPSTLETTATAGLFLNTSSGPPHDGAPSLRNSSQEDNGHRQDSSPPPQQTPVNLFDNW